MSRRKIRTKPRISKPHFFTRDEWQKFTNGRAVSKRRRAKKVDTSPTMPEDDESKENEYTIPAPEKEVSE